jgi:peptide/nickel transport system permease protein
MPEGEAERLTAIPGVVPQPWAMPPGCRFAPRCTMAAEACRAAEPALAEIAPGRRTRCLRWKEMP